MKAIEDKIYEAELESIPQNKTGKKSGLKFKAFESLKSVKAPPSRKQLLNKIRMLKQDVTIIKSIRLAWWIKARDFNIGSDKYKNCYEEAYICSKQIKFIYENINMIKRQLSQRR